MLKAFQKNIPAQVTVISIATVLLWAHAFVMPTEMVEPQGFAPIYNLLYDWLSPLPLLASGIALLLTLLTGYLLNALLYDRKMIPQNTLMPMFLYVVSTSMIPQLQTLHPSLLVNLLLLCILNAILNSSRPTISSQSIFTTTMFMTLAAMCYTPAIWLLIPLLVVFVTYKLYSWNEIMAGLLGILAPIILLALVYYLQGRLIYQQYLILNGLPNLRIALGGASIAEYLCNGFLVVLVLLSLVHILEGGGWERTNIQQNNIKLVMVLLVAGVGMMFHSQLLPTVPHLLAIPFAFAGTALFCEKCDKRYWVWNLLFILLPVVALIEVYLT